MKYRSSDVEAVAGAQQGRISVEDTDPHVVHAMKWPIVIFLAVTSFPAGALPCFTILAYRTMAHYQRVQPGERGWKHAQAELPRLGQEFAAFLAVALLALSVH